MTTTQSGDELLALGYNQRVAELYEPLASEATRLGRVVRVDRGMPLVHLGDRAVRAEPTPQLLRTADSSESRVAVGDWVVLFRPENHEIFLIEAILPRSSAFVRREPGARAGEQVVASCVDRVFVMQAATDPPNLRRLERELVLAWDSGAQPTVLISKIDLFVGDADELLEHVGAAAPGAEVVAMSVITGEGVADVRKLLGPGVTGALLGASGVGKSTLVNRLVGQDLQSTAQVREGDGKGRHTTVARELVPIPGGGVIIDTPGLRALALWEAERGMTAAFADIADLADACRFRNCAHIDEPGCAVRSAIENGDIPVRRLESFLDLRAELDEHALRKERDSRSRGRNTKGN